MASTLDANIKLLRRQGVLNALSLQPHLAQAAYRLPFGASGSHLFGEGLVPILEMEEGLTNKKHIRQLNQVILKQFSGGGEARPKSSSAQSQRGRSASNRGRGRGRGSYRGKSGSPMPKSQPSKEGKGNTDSSDRGKTSS